MLRGGLIRHEYAFRAYCMLKAYNRPKALVMHIQHTSMSWAYQVWRAEYAFTACFNINYKLIMDNWNIKRIILIYTIYNYILIYI